MASQMSGKYRPIHLKHKKVRYFYNLITVIFIIINFLFTILHTALTFAQVFTNVETAKAYQNLFEDLFSCIERDTGETFNFYHIHQKGLGCIIANQHKGQALGKFILLFSNIVILTLNINKKIIFKRFRSIFTLKILTFNADRTFTTHL